MTPDICTSLNCSKLGCKYCPKCSHAVMLGGGRDRNGKVWRWSFNPMFGPLFLRKDSMPLKNQPDTENHRAWEPFDRWLEKH